MNKDKYFADVESMPESERTAEIFELEAERTQINRELEELVREYARLTKDKSVIKKARRIGTSYNDWSYWHTKS